MSYASIIVGCPFDKIFTKVNQPVKKFNPDTGDPYLKDNFVWSRCGVIFEETDEYADCCPDSYLPRGLSHASYDNEDRGKIIVGVSVSNIGDEGGTFESFPAADVILAEKKAKELLGSIGYKGEVKPYLVLLSTY